VILYNLEEILLLTNLLVSITQIEEILTTFIIIQHLGILIIQMPTNCIKIFYFSAAQVSTMSSIDQTSTTASSTSSYSVKNIQILVIFIDNLFTKNDKRWDFKILLTFKTCWGRIMWNWILKFNINL
jgi:hypothetical protein